MLHPALPQAGADCTYLDVAEGNRLTRPITDYSHLVILGGPVSAYDEEQYPFLRYEFDLVEQAIAHRLPTVGICLGAQIVARVLGARVYRGSAGREAGWCSIRLTQAATRDRLFQALPTQFNVFESHQDTFDLPKGCIHLAHSSQYPNQAFCYQDHVWALQFHLEIDEHVLSDCAAVIEQELIESQINDTSVDQLLAEARRHSPHVAPLAASLMQQFLHLAPRAIARF